MTKPEPKKRGPKPKPKHDEVIVEPEAAPINVEVASIIGADPVIAEAVADAVADHDEPAQPEPAFPLIDGADPKFAASVSIGSRHIQFTAHDHITPADVVHLLEAKTVHIPGHAEAINIAARTITPLKMRPVRVTFTVREPIQP